MILMIKSERIFESDRIFIALKLIDNATLFSKDNVIKEYENNKNAENLNELLYEKSIYSNGEKLGFYNISKFTFNDFLEKKYSEKEFKEYLSGFSIEIQELFKIIEPDFSEFNKTRLFKILLSLNNEYAENKNNIQNIFIEKFIDYYQYFNYDEYSNLIKNILCYNVDLKENISILHINPTNHFIFEFNNYLLENNSTCNVDLNVISNNKYMIFTLKFLAIINKINVNFIFDCGTNHHNKEYLIDDDKNFDFIIYSDKFYSSTYLSRIPFSKYGETATTRVLYILPIDFINLSKTWLEKDILESLILIPIKYDRFHLDRNILTKPHVLIVLNYNKPEERKNKFVLIDNTKNKTVTKLEYTIQEYTALINSDEIYNNSFKHFSKFVCDKNSNIISIYEILRNDKETKERIKDKKVREMIKDRVWIDIYDLLYDVKMDSQKTYYKIQNIKKDALKKDMITWEQLNYNIVELKDLVRSVRSKMDNPSKSSNHLYFYTKKYDVDKWVFFDFEIKNPKQYNEIELISDNVSLEYLYYYLNSKPGLNEYEYFFRGDRHMRYPFYDKIRVPIPPKEVQDKIVNSMNKSKNFFNEVNQLKNTINNNFFDHEQNLKTIDGFYGNMTYSKETQEVSISDNWEYTLSGLVWPLAITYLLATSGGFEKVETANNLLRLFEFTTAFNAIVLISGLPENIYENYKTRIWDFDYDKRKNDERFVKKLKLSFGSWVEFNNLLSSAYKKEFKTELNKEFYTKLINKQIRKYYNNLKDERNDEFHAGITNAYDAEILINELNIPKAKIFEYLNTCYNKFKLYYITGRHNYQTNEYEVIFLNGAYSMPIYSTVQYNGFLEPESLYLHDTENDTFSKLNDELIKFKAIDETKRDWRLYIFIGFETINNTKKAIYRCYQRREDDMKVDIDLNEFM